MDALAWRDDPTVIAPLAREDTLLDEIHIDDLGGRLAQSLPE
jgi:hypothetical protein